MSRRPRSFQLSFALGALLVLLAGCASITPRFSQSVQTSFAREEMRKVETAQIELYYPARFRETAYRIAARLDQCAGELRAHVVEPEPRDKLAVFLTSAEFNNAYVQPIYLGNPQEMVLPLHMTLETFDFFDVGLSSVDDISCHESVHYVTFEQVGGFWSALNAIFGDLVTPQSFLDSWLHEGMATYYEGRLGRPVGRPHSPYWRGSFEAGAADGEGLQPGDLNGASRRPIGYGGQYLVGQAFVAWLSRTYGDQKLWELIASQSTAAFSPLAVTLRFRSVFGRSIGEAFDDFARETRAQAAQRTPPASQWVIAPDVGFAARIASSARGELVSLTQGRDDPVQLTVREPDGKIRFSRRLTQVIPPRAWIEANPTLASGLSFSPDGQWIYLVMFDLVASSDTVGRLWKIDARRGDVQVLDGELRGAGGCVTADGKGYVYVDISGDTGNLVQIDLASGARRPLTSFQGWSSISAPACSPDGQRIAFVQRSERGPDLALREPDGRVVALTNDGRFNQQPRWIDGGHLLFLREVEGRAQAHVLELASGAIWPTSDAPYTVLDPVPLGADKIAFLDREGWSWSLAGAPLVPAPAAGQRPTPPSESSTAPAPAGTDGVAASRSAPDPEAAQVKPVPPLQIVRDGPYSAFDHLFVPTLHAPMAWLYVPPDNLRRPGDPKLRLLAAVSLQGADRLGLHNWALNVTYDTKDHLPSFSAAYGTYLLAPWFIDVSGTLVNLGPVYDRQVALGLSRTFWDTPVRLQLQKLDHWDVADDGEVLGRYRFNGPTLEADYFAGETTAYGGVRRGLGLSVTGSVYPKAAGSDFTLGDVAGRLALYLPLPFSSRHRFLLSARGRALFTSGRTPSLIEVGGVEPGLRLLSFRAQAEPQAPAADTGLLPEPKLAFGEFLRGYPDLVTHGTRYGAAGASYAYPIIIDRGWTSFFYLFPEFFIRQVDLEVFGEAALIEPRALKRRSAGGAIYLRTALSEIPLTFFYQLAFRFDAGAKPLNFFGIQFQ